MHQEKLSQCITKAIIQKKGKRTNKRVKMFSFTMATTSLNTTASVQYQRRHRLSGALRSTVRCSVHAGHSTTYSVPSLEKVNVAGTESAARREMTLGEKLRFGGYEEGGELVYKESFVVRGCQVGVNNTATIETIASLLQETSCSRAQRSGWSTDGFPTPPTMKKHRLIWITSRVHIEMYKYPAWGDVVELEHWWEPDGRIASRFDYMIRNLSTGEVIGRATSKWLMMNQDTRKLHKISGEVRDEFLALCVKSPRSAFPEENNASLKKIPQLKEPADYSQFGLLPRRADMDMNKHVNNITYYSWLLQSIPQDIVKTHELQAITIEFRQECKYSDSIDSLASIEIEVKSDSDTNSEDHRQFIHLLKFSGTHHEINRARTVWRKIED